MSYHDKYIKYKMKYLNLKGGAPQFYLPCDIVHDTVGLYIGTFIKTLLDNQNIKLDITDFDSNTIKNTFKQDAIILLKKPNDLYDKRYGIVIRENDINSSVDFEILKLNSTNINTNDYGGNFIASPNNIIFYFNNINKNLHKLLSYNVNKLIKLNCSFNIAGGRHIDECMCFMPYNNNSYKIWIYYIRNIDIVYTTHARSILGSFRDDLIKLNIEIGDEHDGFKIDHKYDDFIKYILFKNYSLKYDFEEVDYGINDLAIHMHNLKISDHTYTHTNNDKLIEIIKNILDPNHEIKKLIESNPEINDEFNLCIDYILNLNKIDGNISFTKNKKNFMKDFENTKIYNYIKDIVFIIIMLKSKYTNELMIYNIIYKSKDDIIKLIRSKLDEERLNNLNIISNELTGKNYEDIKDIKNYFVEFPLDLVYDYRDYLITNVPIFNRICIKRNDNYTFLFSIGNKDKSVTEPDEDIKKILNEEFKEMNINNKYYYINISNYYYKSYGEAGGGLHCLIKNKY